jgi:hypothetical protein
MVPAAIDQGYLKYRHCISAYSGALVQASRQGGLLDFAVPLSLPAFRKYLKNGASLDKGAGGTHRYCRVRYQW